MTNTKEVTALMFNNLKDTITSFFILKKRVIAIEDGVLVRDEYKGGYGFDVQ